MSDARWPSSGPSLAIAVAAGRGSARGIHERRRPCVWSGISAAGGADSQHEVARQSTHLTSRGCNGGAKRGPRTVAITPDGRYLYLANERRGHGRCSRPEYGKTLATFVVGIEPEGVAISPNGPWAYVTAETSNSVSVIDTKKDSVVSSFLVDVRPRAVAWAPDGARVYVSNEISGTVAVIDRRTHELISTIPTDGASGKPVGLVVSSDSPRVYVANGRSGHVSILDARTLRDVGVVTVGRGADLLTATGARGQRRGIRGKAGR